MMRCRRCEAIGFGVATVLAVLLIGAGWWLQVPEGGGGSGGRTVAVALAMFKADDAPAKQAGVAQPEHSEGMREVPERIVRTQPPEPEPEPQKPDPQAESTPQPTATSTPAPEPVAEPAPPTMTKPQQARRPEPAPEPERTVRPDSPAMQGGAEQRVAKAEPSRSPAAGPRTAEKAGGSGLDPSYKAALRAAIEANKRYPRYARMRRQEGEITVAFTVHADGRISDVHIVGEPVSRSLERAAREAVTRVGRFRPLPDNAPSKPMRLRIAMRFDLR